MPVIGKTVEEWLDVSLSGIDEHTQVRRHYGMVDQFWTPWSNQRTDKWGGSLENRTRMSREILTRIQKTCGDKFIVGLDVNEEPDIEIALENETLAEIIARHDREQLMDYVTCGTGGYFDFYKLMPTFLYEEKLGLSLPTLLKSTVRSAKIIAESHIRTPDNAESVLSAQGPDTGSDRLVSTSARMSRCRDPV